jgi:hypothetical protein
MPASGASSCQLVVLYGSQTIQLQVLRYQQLYVLAAMSLNPCSRFVSHQIIRYCKTLHPIVHVCTGICSAYSLSMRLCAAQQHLKRSV